jgi:hypothetical protein
MPDPLAITPETKVAELLTHYPELEDVLIGMAPPFKKLRNPILRRSVAKITSLRQAAAVGRISVDDMVNQLRAVVGQAPISAAASAPEDDYYGKQPDWFDKERIVASLNEADIDPDVMPLNPVISRASKLSEGEIVEFITHYLPAPAIDIMQNKGYLTWTVQQGDVTKTYFSKLRSG